MRESYRFRNVVVPEEIRGGIETYERQIGESLSVSIHIRRGDYLDAADVYGGICTDAYYDKKILEPQFFCFYQLYFLGGKMV